MKITVKKGDVKIIVDETDNGIDKSKTTLKYNDQMENVHSTIMVMIDRCLKLYNG